MGFRREGGWPICTYALLKMLLTWEIKSKPKTLLVLDLMSYANWAICVVPSKDVFRWPPSTGMHTFDILPFFFPWQDWRRRQKEVRSVLAIGEGLPDRLWNLNGYQPWNREPQPLQEDTPRNVQLWGNCTNSSSKGQGVSYWSSLSQQIHSVVTHNLSSSSFQPL